MPHLCSRAMEVGSALLELWLWTHRRGFHRGGGDKRRCRRKHEKNKQDGVLEPVGPSERTICMHGEQASRKRNQIHQILIVRVTDQSNIKKKLELVHQHHPKLYLC